MIDESKELQDFPPVIQNYSSALITLQMLFGRRHLHLRQVQVKTLIFAFDQRLSAFSPYLRSVQVSASQIRFRVNHVFIYA
jgi:hypothetical protein